MKRSTFITIASIALSVILIDQLTKQWAKKALLESGVYQMVLLGDLLKFTYIENPGIAFGIEFYGGKTGVLLLTVFAMIGLTYYFYRLKKDNLPYKVCFGLILGGAIGNLLDRIFYGQVIDFIHLDLYRGMVYDIYVSALPIFNVADMAITTSMVIIFVWQKLIFGDSVKQSEEKSGSSEPVNQEINLGSLDSLGQIEHKNEV